MEARRQRAATWAETRSGRRAGFSLVELVVTITVHPVKHGRPYGRLVSSVLADGKTLGDGMLRMPAPAAP